MQEDNKDTYTTEDRVETSENTETSTNSNVTNYEQSDITKTSPLVGDLLICKGATCMCEQGQKLHLDLIIDSQSKAYLNKDKLMATIGDSKLNGDFKKCKLNPSSGKPCVYQPGEKWTWKSGTSSIHPEINGLHILTESALLKCPVFGGIINITFSGQTFNLPPEAQEELDETINSGIIALLDNTKPEEEQKKKIPNIEYVSAKITDTITKQSNANPLQKITLRLNDEYKFVAKDKNNAGYTYWHIREKTEADLNTKELSYDPTIGHTYEVTGTTITLKPIRTGVFYIESFGQKKNSKGEEKSKLWNSCTFEVTVVDKNEIKKITVSPNPIDEKDNSYTLLAGTTYKIAIETSFPLNESDLANLEVLVIDDSIRFYPPIPDKVTGLISEQAAKTKQHLLGKECLSFDLEAVASGKYTVLVKDKETILKQYSFPVVDNRVIGITAMCNNKKIGANSCVRPLSSVVFEAQLERESDYSKIAWSIDGGDVGIKGKTYKRTFSNTIKGYKIGARYKNLFGIGSNLTEIPINVKANKIDSIKANRATGSLSVGNEVIFRVDTPYIDLLKTEYITWQIKREDIGTTIPYKSVIDTSLDLNFDSLSSAITSLANAVSNLKSGNIIIKGGEANLQKDISIRFNATGTYRLSAKMGANDKQVVFDQEIRVEKCHIEEWYFCDQTVQRVKNIPWGQDLRVYFKVKGWEDQDVKVALWYDNRKKVKDLSERFKRIAVASLDNRKIKLNEDYNLVSISGDDLWQNLAKVMVKNEQVALFFTVYDIDTLLDNKLERTSDHLLYNHIYPSATDNTYAYIPLKTAYEGMFVDSQGKELKEIISYSENVSIQITRIRGIKDIEKEKQEKYTLQLIENLPGKDAERQHNEITFDNTGRAQVPVNMAELYKTRPNDKYKPRFFYLILSDAKEKRIMIYPEDYGIDKNNDKEIVILQKTDYTAQDIKNEEISLQVISKAKEIFLNLTQEQINEGLQKEADRRNKENTKANKDYRGDSKNYFLQLKIAEKSTLYNSQAGQVPVRMGGTPACTYTGECVCKKYNLIWGSKVSCEFRKKVVEICAELWTEERKIEMANGLMAVMAVETGRTFKAHQIMGIPLKAKASDVVASDFDQWADKTDKKGNTVTDSNGKPIKVRSSRAVGLLQFTQAVFEDIGLFKKGSGFDALHRAKLKFAQKGEIAQLDDVKNYLAKGKDKMLKPEDIYIHVFAPDRINMRNPDDVLYDKKTDGQKYSQNKSVDVKEINEVQPDGSIQKVGDGKILRRELLARYYREYANGENQLFTSKCECFEEKEEPITSTNGKWHDPVDNPQINKYNFGGNISPRSANFGNTRVKTNGSRRFHAGIDLFAIPQVTKVYASLDCTFVSSNSNSGSLVLKVINTKELINQKKIVAYEELRFEEDKEYFAGIALPNITGEKADLILEETDTINFFYAHMFEIFNKKDMENQEGIIKAGTHIGYTGVRGNAEGTRAPHLHFEVRNTTQKKKGKNILLNPALFIKLQTYENNKKQDEAKKIWETNSKHK